MTKQELLSQISELIWSYNGSMSEVVNELESVLECVPEDRLERLKKDLSELEE